MILLEEIVRQRQQSDDLGNDALSLLIQAKDEDGNGLSIDELKDQGLLLLFAGHEKLTSALLFAMELLRHYRWELLPDQNLSMVVVPTPHPRDNLRGQF